MKISSSSVAACNREEEKEDADDVVVLTERVVGDGAKAEAPAQKQAKADKQTFMVNCVAGKTNKRHEKAMQCNEEEDVW